MTLFSTKKIFSPLVFVISVSLMIPVPIASATELDERWVHVQREQVNAKQSRIDELAQHTEIMTRQMTEERRYFNDAQERMYGEFMRGLEVERLAAHEQMKVLDDRQAAFERELEKKRAQDELRLKERENQMQRMMSEIERLRSEIKIDQAELDRRIEELSNQKLQQERARIRAEQIQHPAKKGDGEGEFDHILGGSSAVKVGSVSGQDFLDNKPFYMREVKNEYYVEIGDVLDIEVWRVPDLTRTVTVRPDGRISMPLAGDLDVVGATLTDVRGMIEERVADYVIEPQVSIAIRQFGGRKFVILGEVRGPGVYRYEQNISLIEGIALAGGFTPDAKSGQVMVIRGDIRKNPQVRLIKANMQNLLRGGMLTENITIQRNDIIYVGRDFLGDYNAVIREFIAPSINTTIDFFVLRDAIRRVQNRPR